MYNDEAGVENHGRFIIDPDRVIQGYEVFTPPVGRHVAETLRQLQAFQLVRKSEGAEATPSGWKPGKMTLKPGADLVGRVWEVWKTDADYTGKLVSETMLLHGINDSQDTIREIAAFMGKLKPAKSYLSIATRPPAEAAVYPADENVLNMAYHLFSDKVKEVELLSGY